MGASRLHLTVYIQARSLSHAQCPKIDAALSISDWSGCKMVKKLRSLIEHDDNVGASHMRLIVYSQARSLSQTLSQHTRIFEWTELVQMLLCNAGCK